MLSIKLRKDLSYYDNKPYWVGWTKFLKRKGHDHTEIGVSVFGEDPKFADLCFDKRSPISNNTTGVHIAVELAMPKEFKAIPPPPSWTKR